MREIFNDKEKIKLYARIQKRLTSLKPNSRKKSIDKLFEIIPQDFLEQKENLMMICQLFAKLVRVNFNMGKIVIELFKRIMIPIKTHLQDESSLFWNIFGGILYFKLWMYEEGLISIDKIILSVQSDKSPVTAQYFLPEILEKEPEFFHKEIKFKYNEFSDESSYSFETIEKLKSLRKKHFQWLKSSGDRQDPLYFEIETNPLRLAIKLDDIATFQKILSQSNFSINSKIRESIIEKFLIEQKDYLLIEFAAEYNSMNIFKFLLMNNAELKPELIPPAIFHENYEIIHIIETELKESFEKSALSIAITSWNQKIVNYILNNYDYNFLFEKESVNENENITNNKLVLLSIINDTFYSLNFRFFRSTLLPFLRHNPSFVEQNIYNILFKTFGDMSGYFINEILKFPGIDINYISQHSKKSFLFTACHKNNPKAVEILLSNANIDVNCMVIFGYSPLYYTCAFFCDLKIMKMLCMHPKIEINCRDERNNLTAFQMALSRGNAYAAKYLTENYQDIEQVEQFSELASFCLTKSHLLSLKILVDFFQKKCKDDSSFNELIENSKTFLYSQPQYLEEYSIKFDEIIEEVKKENSGLSNS